MDHLNRGHKLRLEGRFNEAINEYSIFKKNVKCEVDKADAIAGIGMALRGLCNYKKAVFNFNQALKIYRKQKDQEGIAFALYGRGGAERFVGQFKTALRDLNLSLELTEDEESRIFTLMARGGLYRMIGDYKSSLQDYTEARKKAGRLKISYAMAYSDCGIGNALRMLGKSKEARKGLKMAAERYRSIDDIVSIPYTLVSLSLMNLSEKKNPEFEEAEKLFIHTGDKRGLIYIDIVKAIYEYLSKKDNSRILQSAKTKAERLGLKLEAAHIDFIQGFKSEKRSVAGYKKLGVKIPKTIFSIP